MAKYIISIFYLLLSCCVCFAACPDDNYVTTTCLYGESGTCYQACDTSYTKVKAAIDAANGTGSGYVSPTSFNGDGVYIPAGESDWESNYITFSDHNLNIVGAGIDTTIITVVNRAFYSAPSVVGRNKFRISGITFKGTTTPNAVIDFQPKYITGSSYTDGWRIDHIKFEFTGEGSDILLYGLTYGVIDNCVGIATTGKRYFLASWTATSPSDGVAYSIEGQGISGAYSFTQELDLGGSSATYIEGCTISASNSSCPYVLFDGDSGMRIVFRYNSVTGGYGYAHWARNNNCGAVKWEIYNNSFASSNAWGTGIGNMVMRMESGTGVVFNNTSNYIAGIYIDERRGQQCVDSGGEKLLYCDNNTHAWDGNIESSGWPCLSQIGRGTGTIGELPSVPLVAWNNTTAAIGVYDCGGSIPGSTFIKSTAHSNGDIDYCDAGDGDKPSSCGNYTNSYSPYVCPHPLTGLTTTCDSLVAGTTGYNVNLSLKNSLSGGTLGGGAMR